MRIGGVQMGVAPQQFGGRSAGDFLVGRDLSFARIAEYARRLPVPPAVEQPRTKNGDRHRAQNHFDEFLPILLSPDAENCAFLAKRSSLSGIQN